MTNILDDLLPDWAHSHFPGRRLHSLWCQACVIGIIGGFGVFTGFGR